MRDWVQVTKTNTNKFQQNVRIVRYKKYLRIPLYLRVVATFPYPHDNAYHIRTIADAAEVKKKRNRGTDDEKEQVSGDAYIFYCAKRIKKNPVTGNFYRSLRLFSLAKGINFMR